MPQSSKIQEWVVRLWLIALGCTVGFLIGEGALRLFLPNYIASAGLERNFFCHFDPLLGWGPLPHVSGLHRRDGFGVYVEQNQFGLRGSKDMQKEKSSPQYRTLILGDSYVWGYGVDQDMVFTEPGVHGSDKELINFGVSGYGTDQALLLYQRDGISFDVDEVVLAFTPYNDVENNLSARQYGHDKPYFTLESQALVLHTEHLKENPAQTLINTIWAQSRVVNVLFTAHRTFQNWQVLQRTKGGTATPGTGPLGPNAVSDRDRKGIALTLALITKLRDTVLATGAKFSVSFIPYKPHILHKVSYNHPLVPLLAKELETAGIPYDEPYFMFLKQAELKSLFNPIDNHFSPEGHIVFSRSFVDSDMREHTRNLYSKIPLAP
ncbi:MAG: SGNH/GDSL hydrolase family protein [Nitrospirae bacterium]|nr:SGNH/GDSL hydrolase family protein [Nitrospirota bacterium]MDA1304779.1 SGNH/GDSL hydrolase family protein [Nitrospirota bacterium]